MVAAEATKKKSTVVPLFPPPPPKESEKKWGRKVMSHGYYILPSMMLQAQARLKVSAQEMMVLLHLVEHWWRAESKVFPAKKVIADRIGLSEKQVQRHVARLEKLGLVKRNARFRPGRGRTTNEYNLSGLVARLKELEVDVAKGKKLALSAKKAGGLTAALAENAKSK